MNIINENLLHELIAMEKHSIPYRKRWNAITGSAVSTLILQQMLYWTINQNWQAFYKFKQPCKHKAYKKGDSWTEELGLTRKEFDTALKKIATKITTGVKKKEVQKRRDRKSLIFYWTDNNRMTWYLLNIQALGKVLIGLYLEETERGFTHNTEITSKITDNDNGIASNSSFRQKKEIVSPVFDGNINTKVILTDKNWVNNSRGLAKRLLDSENEVVQLYAQHYQYNKGIEHSALKEEQYLRVIDVIENFEYELSLEEWGYMIKWFFKKNIKTDYNINHFATSGILEKLYFEAIYNNYADIKINGGLDDDFEDLPF